MSVWYCIPSKRSPTEANICLDKWRAQGYKIALWRDSGDEPIACDLMISGEYPGYAQAVNALCAEVLKSDPDCDWCVTGGDDIEPDPNQSAEEIARQCSEHFGKPLGLPPEPVRENRPDFLHAELQATSAYLRINYSLPTFGVMQPTGDRFAQGSIDRIAGSPWMGREWCERANGGQGPFWPEFTHMFGDEALQRTAQKLGVFWQRPDLIHLHHHFMRKSTDINSPAVPTVIPPHLVEWNSQRHWNEMQAIFRRLEAHGFAPCMPLAEVAA